MEKGLIIAVIGMSGTIVTLWLLTLIIEVLKKVFPYREEEEENANGKERS